MFTLDPSPTFGATVQISVPGGKTMPMNVEFRHKTKSQLAKFQEDKSQTDMAMALEVVVSVAEKREGQTLQQFFEELFEQYPAAALDLYFSYVRELAGSRAKN